jgi:hypothetical protein
MVENFRNFETGPDPFGRSWKVEFRWQQNAISIRHADTVDTKWQLECDGEKSEKVIAIPHPALLALAAEAKRPVTDAWVMKLGGLHLIHMIATWEDMDKTLVTLHPDQLHALSAQIAEAAIA